MINRVAFHSVKIVCPQFNCGQNAYRVVFTNDGNLEPRLLEVLKSVKGIWLYEENTDSRGKVCSPPYFAVHI